MILFYFRTIPDLPNPITHKPFAYEHPPLKPITGKVYSKFSTNQKLYFFGTREGEGSTTVKYTGI